MKVLQGWTGDNRYEILETGVDNMKLASADANDTAITFKPFDL